MNSSDKSTILITPAEWTTPESGYFADACGLAIGNDGVHWEKYSANPIFHKDAFPIPRAKIWDTNLLYHESVYYYFMELGTLDATNLCLTAHQGSLRQ